MREPLSSRQIQQQCWLCAERLPQSGRNRGGTADRLARPRERMGFLFLEVWVVDYKSKGATNKRIYIRLALCRSAITDANMTISYDDKAVVQK